MCNVSAAADREGHVLISAAAAKAAERLRLVFADGAVDATTGPADSGGPGPTGRVERAKRTSYSPRGDDHPRLL